MFIPPGSKVGKGQGQPVVEQVRNLGTTQFPIPHTSFVYASYEIKEVTVKAKAKEIHRGVGRSGGIGRLKNAINIQSGTAIRHAPGKNYVEPLSDIGNVERYLIARISNRRSYITSRHS